MSSSNKENKMSKAKKALLIDSKARTITEVMIGDWKEIAPKIGCDLFTTVELSAKETIYVDDEGLLTMTPETTFFMLKGYPQPLAGNGLVMGTNHKTGDSSNTKETVESMTAKIKFLTMPEVVLLSKMGAF
jgi:hypothetical protein